MVKKMVAGIEVPGVATNVELALFALKVYSELGCNYYDAGKALGVNAATVWKLVNGEQRDSPIIREKWGINRTKTRPRVSVPTNNLDSALMILSKHYPDVEILYIDLDE